MHDNTFCNNTSVELTLSFSFCTTRLLISSLLNKMCGSTCGLCKQNLVFDWQWKRNPKENLYINLISYLHKFDTSLSFHEWGYDGQVIQG